MSTWRTLAGSAGLLAAATLGAGMFALPSVTAAAGWLAVLFYLALMSAVMRWCHLLYRRVVGEGVRGNLLGLVKVYVGRGAFGIAFLAIVGGLLFALVAYLILGVRFLKITIPGLGDGTALLLFWVASSLPLAWRARRIAGAELLGAIAMAGVIVWMFLGSDPGAFTLRAPAWNPRELFLPFGVVLFSLAGWTAVGPMREYEERKKLSRRAAPFPLMAGTIFVAVLYALFIAGVFGSASTITEDTVSGLTNWSAGAQAILGALGLLATWTSYVPIALEVVHSLRDDVKIPRTAALAVTAFLPLVLVFLGLKQFFPVVSLAGGLFLSVQYLFIIEVGRRALRLGPVARIVNNVLMLVFLTAAIYEVYYFVVG